MWFWWTEILLTVTLRRHACDLLNQAIKVLWNYIVLLGGMWISVGHARYKTLVHNCAVLFPLCSLLCFLACFFQSKLQVVKFYKIPLKFMNALRKFLKWFWQIDRNSRNRICPSATSTTTNLRGVVWGRNRPLWRVVGN